jgi:uncharacterized protein YgiM (DUF1202 family)
MNKLYCRLLQAAVIAGLASIMAAETHATAFCNVKSSKDGFVALRQGPSKTARLIGRMRAGDEVMLGLQQKGRWHQVTWYKGEDRHTKGFGAISGKGWVNVALIDEECG